jgi:NitT/TauT family transport system permease protein
MIARLASIGLFVASWYLACAFVDGRVLPPPHNVLGVVWAEARTGDLGFNLGATLARVVGSFMMAMIIGTALGLAMGCFRKLDRLLDAWLLILLNLPALVVVVLCYIWIGLTETALLTAVVLNKVPNTAVMMREAARALDPGLDEMARVFQFSRIAYVRHVLVPQLSPFIAAASRSGLSLVWKIVLVVELLGRSNGVGFEIGSAFQLFDVARILAYAFSFIAVILTIEIILIQPLERHATRWRRQAA